MIADRNSVEASIASKVQRRIVPVLAAAWFIAYVDRFNVGFAALQMNKDLGLPSAAFGFGAGIFFLGYAVFEVPSNALLVRLGSRTWLARIMITWGILSGAMVLTRGEWSFYTLRLLLGIAEAGCFPGIAYYLAQWLSPRDRTAALAGIATMSMVSGVFGGPLAAGLLALGGVFGLAGWQWLFLVEGVPAILIGLWLFKALPDTPAAATWLTVGEREWLRSHHVTASVHMPTRAALATVFRDRRYWFWGMSFFCVTAAGSALRLFQPTILRQVTGYGDVMAALLTTVPSIAGVLVILWVGRHSTRHDERRWHAAVPTFIGGAGLVLVGITYGVTGALIVACLATVGVATQPPLFASVSAASKGAVNAVGIAWVNSVASIGSFIGPYAVGAALDRTGSLAMVCAVAGVVMAIGGVLVLMVGRPAIVVHSTEPAVV